MGIRPSQWCADKRSTILKDMGGIGELEFYSRYVRAIKEKAGNRWPCLLQIGALEEDDYKRLRDAGVDCVHSNPEVWGKDLFPIVCPEKVSLSDGTNG